MEQPYKGLENGCPPPPPYEVVAPRTTVAHTLNNETVQLPANLLEPKVLKLWKIMRWLVFVELILAIVAFIFGSACTGTSYSYYVGVCVEGSGIWVGILCIITSSLGIGALSTPTGRRGLLVAHFVLLILSCIGSGILIIFSSIWIQKCNYLVYRDDGPSIALLSLNVILLLTSLALLPMCIVSSALVCYNWNNCCQTSQQQIIVVHHTSGVQPEIVVVPSGSNQFATRTG